MSEYEIKLRRNWNMVLMVDLKRELLKCRQEIIDRLIKEGKTIVMQDKNYQRFIQCYGWTNSVLQLRDAVIRLQVIVNELDSSADTLCGSD